MATADTVHLGDLHPPKHESIRAFTEVEEALKKELLHLRHTYDKHEPEYFQAVAELPDELLVSFSAENLEAVRVAQSAYGIHIFGKVRLPAMPRGAPAYIQVRIFVSDDPARLHCIHTEESDDPAGGKKYRAIFYEHDELEWFDS